MFVRQDIPIQHQIVQSNHATLTLASLVRPDESIPNIILIGIPNAKSLARVEQKLCANQIPHYVWTEPDFDFGGPTAIATIALDEEQKQVLANYRLYSPVAQSEHRPLKLETQVRLLPGEPSQSSSGRAPCF